MTAIPRHKHHPRGASLLEAVIAVGVLAVAVPLVFGALVEAGKSGTSSQAETRSTWMVPVCMEEIRASREGRPRYFTSTSAGQAFPSSGDVWALAFAADGSLIGKLTKAQYDQGVRDLAGKPVRFITSMSATPETVKPGATPLMRVDVFVEYPAIQKATRRGKLAFHTRIP